MLILIAGITGNIGQYAAHHGLSQGHQIRGLGRSPHKLDSSIRDQLESFVVSKVYYDIPALDKAVDGVDAIICTYAGMPVLHLDAQLLLLRAAERAGVKRFLAAGWNYDWRRIPFQSAPVYDAIISFHAQASISSSIKPLHIFSGMLAEVFFGADGQDGFTPKDNGAWDPKTKAIDLWGTGNEPWFFTTEADAGAFGVELVTATDAEKGGFVSMCSFVHSLREVAAMYGRVRGTAVALVEKGSINELEQKFLAAKEKSDRNKFWEWHRLGFHLNTVKGVWNLESLENDKLPKTKSTGLEEFLRSHPEI